MTQPKLRLEYLDPADLDANGRNWRLHPAGQLRALKDVVEEVGFAGALLYNARTKRLIDGHARKELFAGQKVPVLIGEWSEEQERKILLTFDTLTLAGNKDDDKLLALLRETEFDHVSIDAMLEALANGERAPMPALYDAGGEAAADPGPQIDKAAELQAKWQTARGQVWEIPSIATPGKAHRLMCGDSTLEADLGQLMSAGKAAMVWVDPPYGVQFQGKGGDSIAGDISYASIPLMFANLLAGLNGKAWLYVCGGSYDLGLYEKMFERYLRVQPKVIVWDKCSSVMRHNGYHSCHEFIYYAYQQGGGALWFGERGGEAAGDIWRVDKPSNADRVHLTEKPVELPKRAITNSCPMSDIVLDCFLGSAGAMVAAEQTGRICYGMEIEPKYVAVALERMAGMGLEPGLTP